MLFPARLRKLARTHSPEALRRLVAALVLDVSRRLDAHPPARRSTAARAGLRAVRAGALAPLARRLRAADDSARRDLGALLDSALRVDDFAAAFALGATAALRPDRRAEKVLSHRYRYLWICNPKAASRSLIKALRAADRGARLIRGQTLEEVHRRYPDSKDYFSFAFLRHPVDRTRSFYADKHVLALHRPDARRWFIEPWHGLRVGMSFSQFCLWLHTPCGADAFADRHWLAQWRQIAGADGRLPDFIGSYESLDADWLSVCRRLGLRPTPLPRLNASNPAEPEKNRPDRECRALLRRRYARDYELGGYGDTP